VLDRTAILEIIQAFIPFLGENSAAFLNRVYKNGIDLYAKRLEAYGFYGMTDVLDAGSGFGQWSLALSQRNNTVYSVDISAERVFFLKSLTKRLEIKNIFLSVASLPDLNFKDNVFDAVFCYGVLFLTRWKESIATLGRVLKPGGKIYVNANGFGWYKNLWFNEPNRTADYDPKLHVAKSLYNTWKYHNGHPTERGVDILIEPEELTDRLRREGFTSIHMDAEGLLMQDEYEGERAPPFFEGSYMGERGVYEVIAQKCP
jgi:ubiquinone/menaquinone biosynthesis C-methylase UbiE